MVVSDPSIRYPCAARILQAILMTPPVNSRGFLGGGGLCSPPQAGEQAGRQSPKRVFGYFLHGQKVPLRRKAPPRSASSGGKSRSRPETRNVSLPPAGTAGELRSSAAKRGKRTAPYPGGRKPLTARLSGQDDPCSSGKGALFYWTVHGPFSFRQDEKKMGGGCLPHNGGRSRPPLRPGEATLCLAAKAGRVRRRETSCRRRPEAVIFEYYENSPNFSFTPR